MGSKDYSIVGATQSGRAPAREYDSDSQTTTYTGKGGVSIGNLFDRLVFTMYYGEPNILLNGSINQDSKILYVRNPTDRVTQVAPWLTLDGDPYLVDPAVDKQQGNRIVWIVDGYTTLDDYPYAAQTQLGDVTSDSGSRGCTGYAGDRTISYLRNSVKATVDAYDGTVTLYAFDEADPVLKTWEKVFPGAVKSSCRCAISAPAQLRGALPATRRTSSRCKRQLLARYHVQHTG